MKAFSLYVLFLLIGFGAAAQDLNAHIQVVSPKIQSTNKRIFQTLETAMKDFLNGRKWSARQYFTGRTDRMQLYTQHYIVGWQFCFHRRTAGAIVSAGV